MTGLVAAIAVPWVIGVTAKVAIDQEVELPEIILALEPLRAQPLLGAIPGLIGLTLGSIALWSRSVRIPFALLASVANFVAVLLLVILVVGTMAPMYTYQEL